MLVSYNSSTTTAIFEFINLCEQIIPIQLKQTKIYEHGRLPVSDDNLHSQLRTAMTKYSLNFLKSAIRILETSFSSKFSKYDSVFLVVFVHYFINETKFRYIVEFITALSRSILKIFAGHIRPAGSRLTHAGFIMSSQSEATLY